jgi:disulfide bond formation protein DsbB
MQPSARTWPSKALAVIVPIVGLDLVIQYIAGMGTNVYAPANGFTMNTDFGIYDLHWVNGYALGILSIVLLVFSAFSRQLRNIAASVVVFGSVIAASIAGMMFVNNTPNPPGASLAMGLAFLVAFATVMAMMFRLRVGDTVPRPPAVAAGPAS